MDQLSKGHLKSTNLISLWTFVVLSITILSGRFIIPGWGINIPVYVALTNVFCAVLGIGFLRKVLLNYFTDKVATIILVLIIAGTNLLCLATYEQDVIHPLLFLCYVLILWSTIEWQKAFDRKYAILLGLITAVTISIRITEISCILIPLFWGICDKSTFHDKWQTLKKHHWQSLVVVVLIMLAVLSQILYPGFLYGILNLSNYSQKNVFTFIAPYLPEVLMSLRKGWLIYTPVMIFSILGFYFLAGENPFIFYSAFLIFIINLQVVSSWSVWWDGESFSISSMISSYPVLALPLGYFLVWLWQQKRYIQIPLYLLLGFIVVLNLFQTWQYTKGILDSSLMTREYYGAIFGAVRPDKDAEKYLLQETPDIFKEILHNEHKFTRRVLVHYDFEKPGPGDRSNKTSELSRSGHFSCKLNDKDQFSPGINEKFSKLTNKDYTWIRASGYVYYSPENAIKGAYLVITCNHQNNPYKYKALTLEKENLLSGKWNKVTMDWQTPYLIDKDDLLQVYFWYPGKKSIYVDDIQIEIFEPRE